MLAAVSVVIAEGKRPVSFRTRKLSPPAPMVLHSGGCGRVGRRRTQLMRKPVPPFLWGAGFRCIPGLRGLCRGLRWDGFGRGMAHSGRSGLVPAWAIPRPKPCMAGQQNPALLEESAKARLHRGAGFNPRVGRPAAGYRVSWAAWCMGLLASNCRPLRGGWLGAGFGGFS